MSLEALDGMTADEVRAVDLRVLLYEEREWLARCAVATLGNSAYAATVQAEDVASEIILCIAQPQVIMDRQADMAPDSRARSLRAYCMQIIRTQWRRKFHSQYASVGNADIDEVESVITHDAPERLRTCGISIEQEALLKWEELEDDRRSTMQLETLRDAFPAQQFKVLELSIVGVSVLPIQHACSTAQQTTSTACCVRRDVASRKSTSLRVAPYPIAHPHNASSSCDADHCPAHARGNLPAGRRLGTHGCSQSDQGRFGL